MNIGDAESRWHQEDREFAALVDLVTPYFTLSLMTSWRKDKLSFFSETSVTTQDHCIYTEPEKIQKSSFYKLIEFDLYIYLIFEY